MPSSESVLSSLRMEGCPVEEVSCTIISTDNEELFLLSLETPLVVCKVSVSSEDPLGFS